MGKGWSHSEQPGANVTFEIAQGRAGADSSPVVHFKGHILGGGYASVLGPLAPDGKLPHLRPFESIQFKVRGN